MVQPSAPIQRRDTLKAIIGAAALASTAGCADLIPQGLGLALTPSPLTDPSVYNFALNLEYLEAEYYLRGLTGQGLADEHIGPNPGSVAGGRRVPFQTGYLREMIAEIANDEVNHVRFLRQTISSSPLVEISRPALDFQSSFRAVGQAAGLGADFDPFADEASFLLGAFLFEDVGVTAYAGGGDLIAGPRSIEAAAGILAVEGYHGGMIRTQIAEMGPQMIRAADGISRAREAVESPNNRKQRPGVQGSLRKEQPISQGDVFPGEIVIAPTDPQGRSFPRPPQDVLNIVFLDPSEDANRGGFFPDGVQGVVRHALHRQTSHGGRRA
jgi:hypothetical protein